MADHGVICSMSRSGNVWDNGRDGELLLFAEDRANRAQGVSITQRGQGERVRLHRTLLQSETSTLDDWLTEPYAVREADWISLSRCQPNRVQLKLSDWNIYKFQIVTLALRISPYRVRQLGISRRPRSAECPD
jgi:hypothetical protein